jgi:acyl-ACP thioesterase
MKSLEFAIFTACRAIPERFCAERALLCRTGLQNGLHAKAKSMQMAEATPHWVIMSMHRTLHQPPELSTIHYPPSTFYTRQAEAGKKKFRLFGSSE